MTSNGQGDAAAPGFAFAHVYNPKLEAGRGEQFSASAVREQQEAAIKAAWDAGNDFQLPMGRVDDALDTDGLQQASLEASIPSSNRGFQMLQKMGWSEGKGLGASEDGIVEPVRAGMEAGLRLGLGKAEQESFYISAENVTRKRLETEVQADEDYERTLKREMAVERDQRIKEDTSAAKRNLYCHTCHKQYKNAVEMETHLSSYDHHHAKRLQEMRQATADRTRSERERKERKRAEKEWARLNAQSARAQQASGAAPSGAAAPPPPPPDDFAPPPPPPPSDRAAGAPPAPPAGGRWQSQASGWQSSTAAPQGGGWQTHGSAAGTGPAATGSAARQSSSVGSGGGGDGLLPAAGLAFSAAPPPAAKRQATAAKVSSFGGAVRRQPLKQAVAGFGLDSDDDD